MFRIHQLATATTDADLIHSIVRDPKQTTVSIWTALNFLSCTWFSGTSLGERARTLIPSNLFGARITVPNYISRTAFLAVALPKDRTTRGDNDHLECSHCAFSQNESLHQLQIEFSAATAFT